MSYDIISAIKALKADASVSVNNEDINQITWIDGNPTNITVGFIMQIFWILLLFPVFKKIWSAGTKKYTAMGS